MRMPRGRIPRGTMLREQDSNLQPCGYGMLQSFRFGPDYLIILRLVVPEIGTPLSGCRALMGLIGEYPHPLVSARSSLPLLSSRGFAQDCHTLFSRA